MLVIKEGEIIIECDECDVAQFKVDENNILYVFESLSDVGWTWSICPREGSYEPEAYRCLKCSVKTMDYMAKVDKVNGSAFWKRLHFHIE